MSEQKRYYWIKLKTDFFNQETVDLLLSQPNGCQYVVLYQMLCLITANNDGEMSTRIGEMIVPFNIEKIVRDTKYFDTDTVTVALGLFKKLGLIYEEEGGILRIADFAGMVGSETKYATKQRAHRENKLPDLPNKLVKRLNREMIRLPDGKTKIIDEKRYGGNGALAMDLAGGKCELCGCADADCLVIHHNNGYSNELKDLFVLCTACHGKVESGRVTLSTHQYTQVSTQEIEIRDKRLEYRDIDKEKENKKKKKSAPRFVPPTIEEVKEYCQERNNNIDAEYFVDYYTARDWRLKGGEKMKDWKATVRNWEKRDFGDRKPKSQNKANEIDQDYLDYLDSLTNK